MMKRIERYLLFVFLFLCPFVAKSETITYGGIVYEVMDETHVSPLEIDPSATKIIISDCVEGHEVFNHWFEFFNDPSIADSKINTVEIDTNDANCPIIGGSASPWYVSNSKLSNFTNLKTLIIGNRMTAIPAGLCMGCTSLGKVVFSGSINKIGINAFRYCNSLSDIAIPGSVTQIGAGAFCGCSSLFDIDIPESVAEIGSNTFAGCGFKSVRIPESVTEIGSEAFAHSELESVTIPKGVKLKYGVFKGCVSLEKVIFSGDNEIDDKDDGWYGSLFDGCIALKDVYFGNAHGELQTFSFRGCKSLENLTIPDGLSLGSLVFQDAVIKHLTLSGGNCIFQSEDASLMLERVSIESITIGEEAKIIPSSFLSQHSELKNVNLPSTLEKISNSAFSGCKSLSEIILHDNLKEIGSSAFHDTSLEEILLPESLERLGSSALRGTLLTNLTIPDKVTTVDDNLCFGCKNLKRVVFPANLERIGSGAFKNCEALSSIILPSSVTELGSLAFWGCKSLNTVACLALVPPSAKGAFFEIDNVFGGEPLDHTKISLMVPAKALGDYFRAEEWEKFGIHDGRIWPRHDGGASIRYEYFHTNVADAPARQRVAAFAEEDESGATAAGDDEMVILAGKGTSVRFHITPVEGEQIVKVTYNDEDVTDKMEDNSYVVDSIGGNDVLNVVTTKSGQPTGAEAVLPDERGIRVVDGQVVVPADGEYYIYDISGRLVDVVTDGKSVVLPKGVYIIRLPKYSVSLKMMI